MEKHPINDLMDTTMEKIHSMVDVNTIIGDPIRADGVTLIPISKLSFGFVSGGSDFTTKNQKPDAQNTFGGGSGAGARLEPVAFLIVREDSVKLLPVAPAPATTAERILEALPEVAEKIAAQIERWQTEQRVRQVEGQENLFGE